VVVAIDTMPNCNFTNNDLEYAVNALSELEFQAKPGAPSPSGRSSSAWVVERKAQRGRALGRDGVGHGGVWLGWETTEKRRQRE
jgi:hypothetical protein